MIWWVVAVWWFVRFGFDVLSLVMLWFWVFVLVGWWYCAAVICYLWLLLGLGVAVWLASGNWRYRLVCGLSRWWFDD